MEAGRKRNIQNGEQYNQLFPKADGSTSTIRKNADVTDTVAFIPKVVSETLHHTKGIAKRLEGDSTYKTCANIWQFVYQHIAYKKDQDGFEQIRSPARAWHDRKKGVDCDCYSVFISSILTNLNIPHILRITKYHRDYFQHIYPVVPSGCKEIILDCVTDQFDYEVPYSQKKDYPMDLQYLNGFDDYSIGALGKVKGTAKKAQPVTKKKTSLLSKVKGKPSKATVQNTGAQKQKKKIVLKNVLNKVNKVNPATVLLRNGILAAMKLNIKNIAKRLRWSYLAPEQAAQKGVDPQKFQRLVATREKLEKIFYGAGGNNANLKNAILSGKGNADKTISGLNGFSVAGVDYLSTYTALPQLLGADVYYSENVQGFEALGQLGEPVTLASVGAAMGVLAGIVAALKQIGDIFPKKTKGSEDFDEKTNEAAENNVPVPGTTSVPPIEASAPAQMINQPVEESFNQDGDVASQSVSNPLLLSNDDPYSTATNPFVPSNENNTTMSETNYDTALPATTSSAVAVSPQQTTSTNNFWDKNKSWLKPVAIGVGGVSLIAIGLSVLKPKKTSRKKASRSLSGIPKRRKKKRTPRRKHKTTGRKHSRKRAVRLL